MEKLNNFNIEEEDSINLGSVLRTLIRSKVTVISGTLIFTFLAGLYSILAKPTWRGNMEFAAIADQSASRLNSISGSNMDNILRLTLAGDEIESPKKTQIKIMKSSVILNKVFEYHKEYLKSLSISTNKLFFTDWIKTINIDYEDGTSIIKIAYKNKDQEHILNILNLLKERYEIYSIQNRTEQLDKLEKYLSSQVVLLRNKATQSLKELNKFSIKNGLGNIDGFLDLEADSSNLSALNGRALKGVLDSNTLKSLQNNVQISPKSNAGQRYENLRRKLEEYELLYFDLQSKLKPNSISLISLRKKIDNLKIKLKRPNEILLKYRELTSKARRDEGNLFEVENKLESLKFEKARKDSPWKAINNPVIEPYPVSPNLLLNVFSTFIISLFIFSSYVLYKEKKSEIIFEFEDLKRKIKINYCLSTSIRNLKKDSKLIFNLIKSNINNLDFNKFKSSSITLVGSPKNLGQEINFFSKYDNYKFISLENIDYLENCDYIIFIISSDGILNDDIELINNYGQIYKSTVFGWIYLKQ